MAASNHAFISYRRELGFAWAKLVWDDLRDHGIDGFLDLENVRDAGSFDTKILRQIEGRPYFLLILTRGSLERCCSDGDWLRLELEHAVATDRMIVPLVIPPFDFAEADEALGDEIARALRSANGVTIIPDYFDAAMERLRIDRMEPIEISLRELAPSDEAFAEAARERASQLPPPTPPHGVPPVPPPPDSSDGFLADEETVSSDEETRPPDIDAVPSAAATPDVGADVAPPEEGVAADGTLAQPDDEYVLADDDLPPPGAGVAKGEHGRPASTDGSGEVAVSDAAQETAVESTTMPGDEHAKKRVDAPVRDGRHDEATVPPPTESRRGGRAWIVVVIVLLVAAGGIALFLSGVIGGDQGPSDEMAAGDLLRAGDRLETEDGGTTLVMGADGVLRGSTSGSQWFSEPRSGAVAGSVARMQDDGNFVIYNSESAPRTEDATFATGTFGNRGATLVLLTGRFEIRSEAGETLYPRRAQAAGESDLFDDENDVDGSTVVTTSTTQAP